MAEQAREFDIVIWGATGFAGRLVADSGVGANASGEQQRAAGR